MDGVAEVAGDLHHAVFVHLSTLYLLVHLGGQHAGLVVGTIRHLQPVALRVLLL